MSMFIIIIITDLHRRGVAAWLCWRQVDPCFILGYIPPVLVRDVTFPLGRIMQIVHREPETNTTLNQLSTYIST
jgi:hypothetical protein